MCQLHDCMYGNLQPIGRTLLLHNLPMINLLWALARVVMPRFLHVMGCDATAYAVSLARLACTSYRQQQLLAGEYMCHDKSEMCKLTSVPGYYHMSAPTQCKAPEAECSYMNPMLICGLGKP